ncbi:sugar ABC transporter substrate-binding protein (plasmid) [Rhizobium leguminosarum]|nr:sugar ABC transporter substrate-binding protein [Rhizobium leguminosarum]TBG93487.1 sugar ABC transporter substrate-binding protein [Rhizobium leguminosarum]TBG95956.1 sugar ABC transporter substrate-binding protein [Rhizobium leguminosarum]TBH29078.1 sugar ABC transporter substrate-binding protein [Rhizobium leguminosarum]TBH50324.1 sugar ABC transporter substrate-binding protein [Rhizobium leguminosarum]
MRSHDPRGLSRRSVLKYSALGGASLLAAPFVLRKTARASGESITILNTFPTLANEYWQGWDAGCKLATEQLGLKYIAQTFEDSVDKQISQIEQAPSLGVNAVVTFAQNAEVMKALAATASQVGIKLANAHSTAAWLDADDPAYAGSYLLYSQPDNIRGTAAMAQALFDKIGNEGRVLYVGGLPGNFSADSRAAGVKLALKNNPKIELVAKQPGGENRVAARPVVENLLTAHPDVAAIVSYNDDTAIAVLDVLRERGLSGSIVTAGIDATREMLNRVREDKSALGTVSINAPFMTGYSVVTLYDALEGIAYDPLEKMRYFDSIFLDSPEAAEKYLSAMDQSGRIDFDFKGMSRHLNGDNWKIQWGMEVIDPSNFWGQIESMQSLKPSGWALPESVEASLKAGNADKLNKMYRDHFVPGPLSDVAGMTRSKKTVLGF